VRAHRLTRGRPDRATPCQQALRSPETARTFGTALSGRPTGRAVSSSVPSGSRGETRAVDRSSRAHARRDTLCPTALRSQRAAQRFAKVHPRSSESGSSLASTFFGAPWRGQRSAAMSSWTSRRADGPSRSPSGPRDGVPTFTNRSAGPRRIRLLHQYVLRDVEVTMASAARSWGSDACWRGAVAVFGPARQSKGVPMGPARARGPSPSRCSVLRDEASRRRRLTDPQGGVTRSRVGSPRRSSERRSQPAAR